MDYKQLILKILEAIDYSGDKEKFVNDSIVNTQLETLTTLTESLPEEKQQKLAEEIANIQDDQERATKTLKEYFTEEQIQKMLQEAQANEIKGLLDSVKSTLSAEQKQKVIDVMEQLSSSEESASV